MGIEMLIYCSPMEESNEDVSGWNKTTVDYVSSHRSKIYSKIRGIAKNLRRHNLQLSDVEDIYEEVLMYLYKSDDYNISKAMERSSTNNIVSLEGYLNVCIKYCVVRYITEMYNEEKSRVPDTIYDDEGKSLSLFDTIPDTKTMDHNNLIYDLEALCKSCEILRYKYGPDIYLVWYVRLLTLRSENDRLYKDILSVLGISKRELANIEKYSADDDMLVSLAKAVDVVGVEEAINIIRPYVFSARQIDETISIYA